ncbi:hypothetical protein FGO68_gene2428 [Halteria grandinella]|uniref:Uncharacterized protein n=1 Tax=Halteria grandinella TaxID=5974 RepID=A0A8J8NYV0_HALGN|nr:hypothetical protein FGO68_gene2428 [Halteria grandinella]
MLNSVIRLEFGDSQFNIQKLIHMDYNNFNSNAPTQEQQPPPKTTRSKNNSQVVKDKIAARGACKKQMKESFKSVDMFGQSVSFTWNGEDTYKTSWGAFLSWIILLIMAAYTIYRLIYMVNRWNPGVAKTTLIRGADEDEPFSPSESGFDFAFGIGKDLPKDIGFFTVRHVNQTVINGARDKNKTDLTFTQCGENLFSFEDQAEVLNYKINEYLCTDDNFTDWELQGNFYRNDMLYLEIKLWKCQNSTNNNTVGVRPGVVCQSQTAIDNYFRKQTFNFAFINNQFTTDDYEKPVHPFIDDQLFFEIDPSVSKKANFYIQNAEASLEDTLLQLGWSNDINFHQVSNVRYYDDDYNSADGFVIAVFIRADKMYDSYSRQVTDILTLLGDVGGLQEFFMMIGGLLTSFIASKLFMSSIVKKIYHIRKYENIDYEATKAQQSSSGLGAGDYSKVQQNESFMKRLGTKIHPSQVNGEDTAVMSDRQDVTNTSVTAFQQILDAVKEEEQMSPRDIFVYAIKCLCLRDTGDDRREKSTKKHFLFEKAEEKFMNELDVVRIVRSLRKFKMLAQALLTQKHRMILRFQRQNLVETSSSSSDSDDNLYDPVRLMENKNPLVRLVTYGKVKKMMKEFKGRDIDMLERNMMRGMFRRKLKDFAELQQNNQEGLQLIDRLKMNHFDEDLEENLAKDEFRRKLIEAKIKTKKKFDDTLSGENLKINPGLDSHQRNTQMAGPTLSAKEDNGTKDEWNI